MEMHSTEQKDQLPSDRTSNIATVHQTGETFIIGPKDHAHGPVAGMATSLAVKAKVNINDTNIIC